MWDYKWLDKNRHEINCITSDEDKIKNVTQCYVNHHNNNTLICTFPVNTYNSGNKPVF